MIDFFRSKHRQEQEDRKNVGKEKKKISLTMKLWKWTLIISGILIIIILVTLPTVVTLTNGEKLIGTWGNWTSFSECSSSCGNGTKYRVRTCEHPDNVKEGLWCPGNETDVQFCYEESCPVNGGWGNWSSFSECTRSCGGGMQTRQRICDSPIPAYGGSNCSGSDNDTQLCNTDVCPVHGEWGSWTVVSGCTRSCGNGSRYRVRECNNPNPSYDGDWCIGNATEFQECNMHACPDYRSAFTVRNPLDGPSSGTIKFQTVLTNIGDHYNASTGEFVCRNPGYYIFYFHLYKYPSSSYNTAYCHIRKNKSSQLYIYSDPVNDNGYYETSNSITLHLDRGDIIDLGGCTSASSMWEMTSFSGFLFKID